MLKFVGLVGVREPGCRDHIWKLSCHIRLGVIVNIKGKMSHWGCHGFVVTNPTDWMQVAQRDFGPETGAV